MNRELKIAGHSVTCSFQPERSSVSLHTGRPLQRALIKFRSRVGRDSDLIDRFPNDVSIVSVETDADRVPTRWRRLGNYSSTTYPESPDIRIHSWHLEEFEDLKVSAVEINGLKLNPYRYKETFRGTDLSIECRVKVDGDDAERLKQLIIAEEPVAVVRRGIHDTARTMRMSVLLWSATDEQFKYELELKDFLPSSPGRPWEFAIGWQAIRSASMYSVNAIGAVLERLVSKGILDEEEAKALKDAALSEVESRYLAFQKVTDVDQAIPDE